MLQWAGGLITLTVLFYIIPQARAGKIMPAGSRLQVLMVAAAAMTLVTDSI